MSVLEELGRETTGFFRICGRGDDRCWASRPGSSGGCGSACARRSARPICSACSSWAIVLLTSLCTGMVFSLESANQAVQYGVGNLVGGAVAFTMARELGPMLSAVVVAGRSGAAISAELGSMVVTEQIEALQSLGLSPVRMLVVPRLIALMRHAAAADGHRRHRRDHRRHVDRATSSPHISYDSFINSVRAVACPSATFSRDC